MPSSEVLLNLMGHGFDLNYILGGSRTMSDSTLTDDETALLEAFRSTDDEGRVSALRAVNMERMRAEVARQAESKVKKGPRKGAAR